MPSAKSTDGGRANTVSLGRCRSERPTCNVARVQPTDAVNVSQLSTANSAITAGLTHKINRLDRDLSGGIAAAAAQMNAVPYVPGVWAFGMSGASYNGQGAMGATISRWSANGRGNLNDGASTVSPTPHFPWRVCVLLGYFLPNNKKKLVSQQ